MSDFEFDFDNGNKSRSGIEKKVFIRIPRKDGEEGYDFLTLGTLARIAWNINIQNKPIFSMGRKTANGSGTGVKSVSGLLAFNVMETSTIEYLKNQYKETVEDQRSELKMSELPMFDVVLVSGDENDLTGSYSKRVITGVQIFSESGATGTDVIAMMEEYSFKAINVGALKLAELEAFNRAQ